MRPKLDQHLDYFILAALAALCYVLFFYQLGGVGLMGPDEPRYAAVARTMYETGDYITPRLWGETWFEKPVLMYWLAAIGYALFGVGETGARFPSALGATLSVFLIYWCGRRLFSRWTGFAAALILVSSLGFFALARAASMDMPLTAALTAALVFFLLGHEADEGPRRWYFYGFYAALGFGVLAKGPIAILLPALTLVLFLLWRGGRREWRGWHLEGVLVTILVAAPWYIAVTWVNGWEFIQVFLLDHNLQRFATDVYGHDRPFYFYVPVLLLMMFPWTFLLIPALRRRFAKNEQLILMWALIPFVFFSLSGSKLPAYILPMAPPIALLCARELCAETSRLFKLATFLQALLVVAVGVTFGFFGEAINVDFALAPVVLVTAALVIAGALIAIGVWLPPPVLGAFNVVTIGIVVFAITNAFFPRAENLETMRPWTGKLDRFVSENQEVLLYKPDRWMEYGLQFYRDNRTRTALSEEQLAEMTDPGGARLLCIAEDRLLDELSTSNAVEVEVVETVGNQAAFWVWRLP